MSKFTVRRSIQRFVNSHIGWQSSFRSYGDLAAYLLVRPATVSSWVNAKSDISLFTFLRISLAFSLRRKERISRIVMEFLKILDAETKKSPSANSFGQE
jgi:hypothetical protein